MMGREVDLGLQSTGRHYGAAREALPYDLIYLRTLIANVYFCGERYAGDRNWVLIDAGVQGSAGMIAGAARARFGRGARPSAIVLTHGHFDHVGALQDLAEAWDVPVYAHPLELPYITGRSAYPPPDPRVGGGMMAALSFLYPRRPVDVGRRARPLPQDGSVPFMPGWRWVHTPGHTPGHVSLFREADRTLIAGDAVVTTRQESASAVLVQRPEMHGPPTYFTQDWEAARRSVERIAELDPFILATGHGLPLAGEGMRAALNDLAWNFDRLAVPSHGRYVPQPAIADERGTVAVPPSPGLSPAAIAAGLGLAALVGYAATRGRGRRRGPYDYRG